MDSSLLNLLIGDRLNAARGDRTITFVVTGLKPSRATKVERVSPRYTTWQTQSSLIHYS